MGTDYGAGFPYVIDEDGIRKIIPKEFSKFKKTVERLGDVGDGSYDSTLLGLAKAVEYEGDPDLDKLVASWNLLSTENVDFEGHAKAIVVAYNELRESFEDATRVDNSFLSLYLSYLVEDQLCRGSSLEEGVYWHLGGVDMRSPAGKKYDDLFVQQWYIAALI